MNWTVEQVLSFAPDTGTATRGKKLANSKKWQSLEKNERAIWGLCKGSGSRAYETGVDFNGPAFKCTCPVRKPPCKHVMGLMLSYVNQPNSFTAQNPPSWIGGWLGKRDARTTKAVAVAKPVEKEEKVIYKTSEELYKAQRENTKTFAKRLPIMQKGTQDLELWLTDLLRTGLANAETEPYTFWDDATKRMINSKVKGLASMVAEMPLLISSKTDWVEKILKRIGDIYLYIKAFEKVEELPLKIQSDIYQIANVTVKKVNLNTLNGVEDEWMILGQRKGTDTLDPDLTYRRTWFWGVKSGQPAMYLDFEKSPYLPFERHFMIGKVFKGELVYYPGNVPLRANIKKEYPPLGQIKNIKGVASFDEFLEYYAKSISVNPWLWEYPCPLENITPIMENNELILIDKNKKIIPVSNHNEIGWKLLALSGGHPINIFGEWSGELLVPLSASINGQFITL